MRTILALCLLLAVSTMASATCTVGKLTTVPATFAGGKVYLPVQLNESTALFMLDTGSADTIVNAPFAAQSGAGMDRRAQPRVFTGAGNKETLPVFLGHVRITRIGDIKYQDWEYSIVDLGGFGPKGQMFGGLLGMDFLHYFDIEIDFAASTVSIYRLSGCSEMHPPSWTGDYAAIPLTHRASNVITLPVFLDNADLDMQFDTGAQGVLLSRDAAAKAGVSADTLAHDPASNGGGVAGRFNVASHHFKLLLIGKGIYPDVDLRVENEYSRRGETDGLLGLAALKAQRVWISFTTNTLFVQGAPAAKGK